MTASKILYVSMAGLAWILSAPLGGFAALVVDENSTWPSNPVVETFEYADAPIESERDVRFERNLSQTFQVPSAFQLDKIFVSYENGLPGKEITIHLFPVADVNASGTVITPIGPDLLGLGSGLVHTTTASINTADAGNNTLAVIEFDLTGLDEVLLLPSIGTEGYAFQIERTGVGSDIDDGAETAFKWHYNNDDDLYAFGRSAAIGGGPDDAGDDFLLALKAVPEPGTLALGALSLLAMGLARRRRPA